MSEPVRIQSFSEFWPYYIGEHRHPTCRALHFVGTGGFIAVMAQCVVASPVRMGAFLVGGLIVANVLGTPGWLARSARGELFIKAGLVVMGAEILLQRAHP